MKLNRRFTYTNIYESFSDVSLLMLATFIFLMVTILITSRMEQEYETPKLKKEIVELKDKLAMAEIERQMYASNIETLVTAGEGSALDKVIESTTFGRKDFDLFVNGLKDLPGKDLHLIVDASGSMHGLSNFLIPILRAIIIRSDKELGAITWFSDGEAETYTGTMGEMFDKLMSGAPFGGNRETIGKAFRIAERNAPIPGAYILIGDEPSDDEIYFTEIPSPVFTLPLGRSDPATTAGYQQIADKTKGKMLHLDFR